MLQGNDVGETVNLSNATQLNSSSSANDFKLLTHKSIQKELEPYTELMRLLKALDQKAFSSLTKVYTKTMGTLYQRNFKFFFEEAKERLIASRLTHQHHCKQKKKFFYCFGDLYQLRGSSNYLTIFLKHI